MPTAIIRHTESRGRALFCDSGSYAARDAILSEMPIASLLRTLQGAGEQELKFMTETKRSSVHSVELILLAARILDGADVLLTI